MTESSKPQYPEIHPMDSQQEIDEAKLDYYRKLTDWQELRIITLEAALRDMLQPYERFTDFQIDRVIEKNGGMSYGMFGLKDALRVKIARVSLVEV